MTTIGAGAGNDSAKRFVKRIRHSHDEANKSRAAIGCKQSQQEAQTQQRIDYIKDVIDNLRDSRDPARASDLALGLDNFVNGLSAELACELILSALGKTIL